MTIPRTAAIIVNWRTPELTLELLHSLPFETAPGLRAIVVDNNSGDGSAETLRAALAAEPVLGASVALIESAENGGFTGGVNLGVTKALEDPASQAIWLLNPDAQIPAGTFEELTAVLSESGAAAVSPTLHDKALRWYGEHHFPRAFWARQRDYFMPNAPFRWWRSERFHGACALFDADAVRELMRRHGHFLDPGTFMYWDEWDCSLRLAKAGAEFAIAGRAGVEHTGGEILERSASARMRQYYSARNAVIVVRRNVGWWQFPPLLGIRLVRDALWFAHLRRRGRHPNVDSYLRGTLDGLRGRSGRWENHPK